MKIIWSDDGAIRMGELDDSLHSKFIEFCIINNVKAVSNEEIDKYGTVIRMIKDVEEIEPLSPRMKDDVIKVHR